MVSKIMLVAFLIYAISQINTEEVEKKKGTILGNLVRLGGDVKLELADAADSISASIKGIIKDSAVSTVNAISNAGSSVGSALGSLASSNSTTPSSDAVSATTPASVNTTHITSNTSTVRINNTFIEIIDNGERFSINKPEFLKLAIRVARELAKNSTTVSLVPTNATSTVKTIKLECIDLP